MWHSIFRPARSRRAWNVARALLVAVAVGPLLVPLLEHIQFTGLIGGILRDLYGLQCHQRRARTPTVGAAVMPVCARCLGIYLGLGLAALVGRPRLRADPHKAWILVGAMLVAVDVATEAVRLRPASAWLRTATGAFLAYGIALSILEALRRASGREEH